MANFTDSDFASLQLSLERECAKCAALEAELILEKKANATYKAQILDLRRKYELAHLQAEVEEEALVNKVSNYTKITLYTDCKPM